MSAREQIPPGYKETEVGVIPDDWEVLRLSDFGKFKGGDGFPLRYQGRGFGDYPFFKVSDMNNEGNSLFMNNSNHWISETVRKELGATAHPGGSIVFAKIGAAIFLERKKILSRASCIDNNMMAFVFNSLEANSRFFHYLFLTVELGKLVSATALPSLNGRDIAALHFGFPNADEQRAIAAALSDVDALIGALDALIAKKRDIKQATMQQLLTGKTRLPGLKENAGYKQTEVGVIPDDWEVAPFEAVFRKLGAKAHQIQTSEYLSVGTIPVVDQGQQTVVGFTERADKVLKSPGDGVIIFGDHTCIIKYVDFDFVVGADGTQILATRGQHSARFHAYSLEHQGVEATGYNRHFKFLKERPFLCPPPEEQRAIAAALHDIDAELTALEAKRDKTSALKTGMMQELLTGRIRLL